MKYEWVKEFSGAVTVCDPKGIILEMNDKAALTFQEQGGKSLVGTNLFECHSEASREKLSQLMKKRQTNIYTFEKKGSRRLVYQTPWYSGGRYRGFVEVSLEIPEEIPHQIRDT